MTELSAQILKCKDCPLGAQEKNKVPGYICDGGSPRVVIILDYPTIAEAHVGIPLVDMVGERVNPHLEAAGIPRSDLAILHCVKCSTPNDRYPSSHELVACSHYLRRQLALMSPKLMLVMGKISMNEILGVEGHIIRLEKLADYEPGAIIEKQRPVTTLGTLKHASGELIGVKVTHSPHTQNEDNESKIAADINLLGKLYKTMVEISDAERGSI